MLETLSVLPLPCPAAAVLLGSCLWCCLFPPVQYKVRRRLLTLLSSPPRSFALESADSTTTARSHRISARHRRRYIACSTVTASPSPVLDGILRLLPAAEPAMGTAAICESILHGPSDAFVHPSAQLDRPGLLQRPRARILRERRVRTFLPNLLLSSFLYTSRAIAPHKVPWRRRWLYANHIASSARCQLPICLSIGLDIAPHPD